MRLRRRHRSRLALFPRRRTCRVLGVVVRQRTKGPVVDIPKTRRRVFAADGRLAPRRRRRRQCLRRPGILVASYEVVLKGGTDDGVVAAAGSVSRRLGRDKARRDDRRGADVAQETRRRRARTHRRPGVVPAATSREYRVLTFDVVHARSNVLTVGLGPDVRFIGRRRHVERRPLVLFFLSTADAHHRPVAH